MIKKNNRTLEKNNEILGREVQELKRQQEEQKIIWEKEVLDLCNILGELKDKLRSRSDHQFSSLFYLLYQQMVINNLSFLNALKVFQGSSSYRLKSIKNNTWNFR